MPEDKSYLLALHAIPGMRSRLLTPLLQEYSCAQEAWERAAEWPKRLGAAYQKCSERRWEIVPDLVYEKFLASGLQMVTLADALYPPALREIYEPPHLLFYKGELPAPEKLHIAIIGSRHATAYGKQVASWLATALAKQGVVIVGGLARGIDAVAHQGALDVAGETIAVLGNGAERCYPPENHDIYQKISLGHGAVISEFPIGAPPWKQHFPLRNRLISGLAQGIVVVEAEKQSGTSITVNHGLEQGKEIFAVPGPIFSPNSVGTHDLIKSGHAYPITQPEDILSHFSKAAIQPATIKKQSQPTYGPEEERIRRLLVTPMHFDALAQELGLSAQELAPRILAWLMSGIIQELPGRYYVNQN